MPVRLHEFNSLRSSDLLWGHVSLETDQPGNDDDDDDDLESWCIQEDTLGADKEIGREEKDEELGGIEQLFVQLN